MHDTTPAPIPSGEKATPDRRRRRRRLVAALLTPVLVVGAVAVGSFATAVARGQGSMAARAAEWARTHGGASAVGWVENAWYSHHAPPVGGRPPSGAIPPAAGSSSRAGRSGLAAPPPIAPIAAPGLAGEGVWHAAGPVVEGSPAVYTAYLRPDRVHTSLVAGVAWMDPRRVRFQLYKGSYIPGHGPWRMTAPVSGPAASRLVAAFNAGFRLADAAGGYYSEGRTVAPLVEGAASLVVYRNGHATVGAWGRDARMSPQVSSVRQNLRLIVDRARPVAGLNNSSAWGATLGNRAYVWRSGLGETASGALVYAGGPGLDMSSLADVLVHAGAVRAMELDINTDWVNFSSYGPGGAASPAARTLLPDMRGGPDRYLHAGWNRDFVVARAR